jgi:hypothetical protein
MPCKLTPPREFPAKTAAKDSEDSAAAHFKFGTAQFNYTSFCSRDQFWHLRIHIKYQPLKVTRARPFDFV